MGLIDTKFTRGEFLKLCGGAAATGLFWGRGSEAKAAQLATSKSFLFTDRKSRVTFKQPKQTGEENFTFAVFGDRTSGLDSGLLILQRAVDEVNILQPDMVMNVGDLVQGYNQRPQWKDQCSHYRAVMNHLDMPWFPTPGNHDIYWRGDGQPEGEHEGDYEYYMGPLWYAFEHNGCGFIVLYSDEGNLQTGEKDFKNPECQSMSPRQTQFLRDSLKRFANNRHVFIFLHHPRWTGDHYGDDWNRIHKILKQAGNVSACFAGHTHRMKFNGVKDGITYHTLATTGGNIPGGNINSLEGVYQHYDIVTVRGNEFHVGSLPVGSMVNPSSDHLTQTLLPEETWVVRNEASRVLTWPIVIPSNEAAKTNLVIGVQGGGDNAGDRGVHYELKTEDNKVVKKGFTKSNDYHFIEVPVQSEQRLTFTIMEEDTIFTGKAPGNGGRIKMNLKVKCKAPNSLALV